MRMRLAVPAVLAVLALATGCGGGSSGSASSGSSGADIVPAGAPVFISVNSDLSSDQWKKLDELAKKFPGRGKAIQSIEASMQKDGVSWKDDVKPALGKEIDLAFLDFAGGGNDVVVITKPKDEQKLNAALEKGTSAPKHMDVDGWTVYASSQSLLDRFKKASAKGDHLSDDAGFKNATADQPDETIAKLYVRGSALSAAVAQGAATSGSSVDFGQLSKLGGKVDWIAGNALARDDGVRLEAREKGDQHLETYTPSLTGDLPAGALLVVSFNDLGKGAKNALDTQLKSNPNARAQLTQAEQALGFSIEKDVIPLLSKEGAFALYPSATSGSVPTLVLALKVDDEQKATQLLDRLGALAGARGGAAVAPVTVDGVSAKRLTLGGYSIYYAAFDGKLVVTNAEAGLAGIHGGGTKLDADPLFKQARDKAGGSGETTGFLYVNLEQGLPAAFDAAGSSPGALGANEQEVRANTKPLRALYVGSTKDGDQLKLTGFLTIQ